jgi:type II secretory pathway pseudopilin PulG
LNLKKPHYLPERAFTLLEVCFALFIVAVLFVVAVPPAARLFEEESLQRPIRELQSYAKTARRLAMVEHQPYEVLLLNDGYAVRPVEQNTEGKQLKYRLPDDITYEIRRIGDSDFRREADARWFFASNGLCEPMTFLFQRKNSWIRFEVNPLTARIENQQSFIQ